MNNIKLLFTGCIAALLMSGCGITNDGFSGSSIQKRKYTKGFYFSKNKSWAKEEGKKSTELKAEEILVQKEENTILDEKKIVSNESEYLLQDPSLRKTDKVDQNSDVKTEQKKSSEKKSTVSGKKTSTSTQSTTRKPRVPERYIPMKEHNNVLKSPGGGSDVNTILLVILAILIPPLAVFLYEGASKRFWIDLVLALIGIGVGFWLFGGGVAYLCMLVAVIYALLIVLGAI